MGVFALDTLQSDAVALKIVRALHPEAPPGLQYRAAAHVAASVRLAISLEQEARDVGMELRALALYYSLLNWLKAAIHLKEPTYPRTALVLQHGVSVRRSKRDDYRWPYEVLLMHKQGVLQSFRDCYHPHVRLPSRCLIGDLLGSCLGTVEFIACWYPQFRHLYRVTLESGPDAGDMVVLRIPRSIASGRGLTIEQWVKECTAVNAVRGKTAQPQDALSRSQPTSPQSRGEVRGEVVGQRDTAPRSAGPAPVQEQPKQPGQMELVVSPSHPWLQVANGCTYLADAAPLPETVIHYGLLYSLSALSRYNPVEWSDIIHWNSEIDATLVRHYLDMVTGWRPQVFKHPLDII